MSTKQSRVRLDQNSNPLQPLAHATLRVALTTNIFQAIDEEKATTVNVISSRVGADPLLVCLFSLTRVKYPTAKT